jgi:hypothetical protein
MPFKSARQKAYLYAHRPDLAKEFEADTPKGVVLPEKLPAKRKGPRRSRSLQGPPLR